MSDSYFLQLHVQQIILFKKYSSFILVLQNDKRQATDNLDNHEQVQPYNNFHSSPHFDFSHTLLASDLWLYRTDVDDPLPELSQAQHLDQKCTFIRNTLI